MATKKTTSKKVAKGRPDGKRPTTKKIRKTPKR